MYLFIYLKVSIREIETERECDGNLGLAGLKSGTIFPQVSQIDGMDPNTWAYPTAFQGYQQGADLEEEQQVLKLAPTCDATSAGDG